ncbi:hypothetical protein QR680_017828 [Steinernema hermaphroditum]|uniref:G-protein coupled receptors family 1 profile domain-containing protein n=1 Tax=Steinernema hermaphroditum TaxID=289476 RepID=A0AA39LPT9_9BILA|nr:hypothetical protein QR680_017828 [Steinernema hermaphroditum]
MDVWEEERQFGAVRRAVQCLACVSINFNGLAVYLILKYSPKHLSGYKFVLLNICMWSIIVDMHVAFVYLPMPHLEIVGAYSTGLAGNFSPLIGFSMLMLMVYFLAGYLMSLGYGFVYRLLSVQNHPYLKTLNSRTGIAILVVFHVVPPAAICILPSTCYIPTEEYKAIVAERHPESLVLFEKRPLFGSAFDKRPIILAVSIIVVYILLWFLVVSYCLLAIVAHMSKSRLFMSARTYRFHLQLFRALAVQTFLPTVLLLAPIIGILLGFVLQLPFHNALIEVAEIMFGVHSSINCFAMIVLITPYRRAVLMVLNVVVDWIDKKTNGHRRRTIVDTSASRVYFVSGVRQKELSMVG